jgi:hypothetical protein
VRCERFEKERTPNHLVIHQGGCGFHGLDDHKRCQDTRLHSLLCFSVAHPTFVVSTYDDVLHFEVIDRVSVYLRKSYVPISIWSTKK